MTLIAFINRKVGGLFGLIRCLGVKQRIVQRFVKLVLKSQANLMALPPFLNFVARRPCSWCKLGQDISLGLLLGRLDKDRLI